MVGDDKGWTPNFDYQAWAEGKEFVVGDKLVFKYQAGAHNVFRVNGTVFQQCMVPPASEALTTGNDVINLTSPGRKWYICGVAKHCELGNQKLAITVLPLSVSPASSPSGSDVPISSPPVSSTRGIAASSYYGWMAAIYAIVLMVMV
ncbi:hypothetical protein F0562_012983 [Nyssa sinensis]|uniref:Phytocyanin domain-containing protein n=1 Tax=Nyssa sinensis TaxID=561372 RepID=A0A5J4ZVC9_9ASTE|nr:hypothetical protein F0562_012983 [Nyssa sinensis]